MSATEFTLAYGKWTIDKDPESRLDFGARWDDPRMPWLLPGDSVQSAIWEVSPGLVMSNPQVLGNVTYVTLEDGVLYAEEWARVTMTTAQGRIEQQTLYFNMVDK